MTLTAVFDLFAGQLGLSVGIVQFEKRAIFREKLFRDHLWLRLRRTRRIRLDACGGFFR